MVTLKNEKGDKIVTVYGGASFDADANGNINDPSILNLDCGLYVGMMPTIEKTRDILDIVKDIQNKDIEIIIKQKKKLPYDTNTRTKKNPH